MKQFKVFVASILFILFIPVCIKWIEFIGNHIFESKDAKSLSKEHSIEDDANAKYFNFKLKKLTYNYNTVEIKYSQSYQDYDTIIIPPVVHINGEDLYVTTIGEKAFEGCSKLKNIVLPYRLERIDNMAFYGCSELTNIKLPSSLKYIGDYAFVKCVKLLSVELPNGLYALGDHSFYGCISMSRIVIPPTVTYIGHGAFDGCSNLTIVVEDKKENVKYETDSFKDCKAVVFRPLFDADPNNPN